MLINRYGSYGLAIDIRHKMLLADCMTYVFIIIIINTIINTIIIISTNP